MLLLSSVIKNNNNDSGAFNKINKIFAVSR